MTARALVGRDAELATLRTMAEVARGGRGGFALVVGEPGIGKSTLVEALLGGLEGVRVARARCWDPGARAFWPWSQIAQGLDEASPLGPGAETGTMAEERVASFDRMASLLRHAARRAPLVCVIEDLHAADESSLLLLGYLAVELSGAPILFVATARDEGHSTPAFDARRRELERAGTVVRLAGLDAAALSALVGPALSAQVEKATSGNPLFAVELAALLARPGARAGSVPVPPSARAILRERLDALPELVRRVVSLAAVLGPPIDPGLVAALGRLDPLDVLEALETAQRGGVLVAGAGAELHTFRHDLVREVAYEVLPARERAELHLRAGELTEGSAFPREVAARHYLRALPLGSVDRAAARALAVADEARDAFAWESACRGYEDVLGVLERSRAAPERLLPVLLSLAETELAAGLVESGHAHARRAIALSRKAGRAEDFARGVLALGTVTRLGMVDPAFVALLDEAIAHVPGESILRARLGARLAAALQPGVDWQTPHVRAREAIALARRVGTPRELGMVIDTARNAFRVVDDMAERHAMDEEALALALATGATQLEVGARRRLAVDALERGDVARALAEARTVLSLGTRLGSPLVRWYGLQLESGIAILEGRFDASHGFYEAALAETEAGAALFGAAFRVSPLAMFPGARARAEGSRGALEAALADPRVQSSPLRPVLIGYAAAALDRAELMRPALDDVRAMGTTLAAGIFQRQVMAELTVALGLAERVAEVLPLLEPLAGRAICWFPLGICEGAWDRLRGRLLLLAGRAEEAVMALEAAIALEERLRTPPWLARSRLALATALRAPSARRDLARADALEAAARATFEELGMEVDLARLSAAPASVVPAAPAASASARPELTLSGETWSVRFGDEHTQLSDLDGLRYLAYLLEHAGTSVPARELLALSRRGPGAPVESTETPVLDARARSAYRERIADLREALEEAEDDNDLGRARRAREELERVTEELARAAGLGGRDRTMGSAGERARVNATLRIRKAIAKIAQHCPRLGAHLEARVRTGTLCRYEPEVTP